VLPKQACVDVVQRALAHRGGRLQLLDRIRSRGHAHLAHAERDRPRGHERGCLPVGMNGRHLAADLTQDVAAHLAGVVRDER
jgi:hypothetical protein